ncbi:MAG: response regulator, partial [Polyangiaceae bacterium]|nr:response regulator [Polyangiaceae bacterium]
MPDPFIIAPNAAANAPRVFATPPTTHPRATLKTISVDQASTDSDPPSQHANQPLAVPAVLANLSDLSVLVIGAQTVADYLRTGSQKCNDTIDIHRSTDLPNALELTRAIAPDVIVLDADLPGAANLCKTLARDPFAESIPIVTIGVFYQPHESELFTANGVAAVLTKPISPPILYRSVRAAVTPPNPNHTNEPIGLVTVQNLAELLAKQLKSGLLDTVRRESTTATVDFGQGTELRAAIWSTIARVRELLSVKSGGAIRFPTAGPIAIPIAPSLDVASRDNDLADTNPTATPMLPNRRVLVVDDDPAVTWFLCGLFRAHGAEAKDAPDGIRALDTAYRFDPDLIVTDTLMPSLDGFGLCRALKRDPLLRDVPVILLAWKEALLQRIRDLGVGTDGYLRREATSEAILRTVNECLRPRTQIEDQLQRTTEAQGRLGSITTRTLIRIAEKSMPNASISIRNTSHLFDIQIRDGSVAWVSRTACDGSRIEGENALVPLLHLKSGRFHIKQPDPTQLDSARTPTQQLQAPFHHTVVQIAVEARAAQSLLDTTNLDRVRSVVLCPDLLDLDESSELVCDALVAIAAGTSPQQVVELGIAPTEAVEQALADAVAKKAVVAVIDHYGKDLLAPAVDHQLRALEEQAQRSAEVRNRPTRPSTKSQLPTAPGSSNSPSFAPQFSPSRPRS